MLGSLLPDRILLRQKAVYNTKHLRPPSGPREQWYDSQMEKWTVLVSQKISVFICFNLERDLYGFCDSR